MQILNPARKAAPFRIRACLTLILSGLILAGMFVWSAALLVWCVGEACWAHVILGGKRR
jgi:hypothetical protein